MSASSDDHSATRTTISEIVSSGEEQDSQQPSTLPAAVAPAFIARVGGANDQRQSRRLYPSLSNTGPSPSSMRQISRGQAPDALYVGILPPITPVHWEIREEVLNPVFLQRLARLFDVSLGT